MYDECNLVVGAAVVTGDRPVEGVLVGRPQVDRLQLHRQTRPRVPHDLFGPFQIGPAPGHEEEGGAGTDDLAQL